MTKEEFLIKLRQADLRIKDAKASKQELINSYIGAATKYSIGDKVAVKNLRTKKMLFAFIGGVSLSYFKKDIEYILLRCKKDGTPSKVGLYKYDYEILGLAE